MDVVSNNVGQKWTFISCQNCLQNLCEVLLDTPPFTFRSVLSIYLFWFSQECDDRTIKSIIDLLPGVPRCHGALIHPHHKARGLSEP